MGTGIYKIKKKKKLKLILLSFKIKHTLELLKYF